MKKGGTPVDPELVDWANQRLRRLASALRHGLPNAGEVHTGTLLHETYLRVRGNRYESDTHFYYAARKTMYHVMSNSHRAACAKRRRPEAGLASLSDLVKEPVDLAEDRAVRDLLLALRETNGDAYDVFEARELLGRTIQETAEILEISPTTVKRRWRAARLLLAALSEGSHAG